MARRTGNRDDFPGITCTRECGNTHRANTYVDMFIHTNTADEKNKSNAHSAHSIHAYPYFDAPFRGAGGVFVYIVERFLLILPSLVALSERTTAISLRTFGQNHTHKHTRTHITHCGGPKESIRPGENRRTRNLIQNIQHAHTHTHTCTSHINTHTRYSTYTSYSIYT